MVDFVVAIRLTVCFLLQIGSIIFIVLILPRLITECRVENCTSLDFEDEDSFVFNQGEYNCTISIDSHAPIDIILENASIGFLWKCDPNNVTIDLVANKMMTDELAAVIIIAVTFNIVVIIWIINEIRDNPELFRICFQCYKNCYYFITCKNKRYDILNNNIIIIENLEKDTISSISGDEDDDDTVKQDYYDNDDDNIVKQDNDNDQ